MLKPALVLVVLSAAICAPEIETLPAARGGQDLVGTRWPDLDLEPRLGPQEPGPVRATLYRWWTDSCPYCQASLPAVETLRRDLGPRGLRVIGVYHPKPPRSVADDRIRATARRLGYHGVIAVDEQWSALETLFLSTGKRRATSASFLVDAKGIIRFVHPGPVYFPSDDPRYHRENADYRALRKAIESLLGDGVSPEEEQ